MSIRADALNGVCPYYTMYPLNFPLRVLKNHGCKGDWVLDPFCGRGTTNFAARLLGMPSIGVDSSPVAAALAKAKLAQTDANQILAEAQAILNTKDTPQSIPNNEFWRLAYSEKTLAQLCKMREALINDCTSDARILLRAIILGALHGPRPKGFPSYFSNQSPRTFAPKPNYAIKFWKTRKMYPEDVDILAIIEKRAQRYLAASLQNVIGIVRLGDSRDPTIFQSIPKVRFIITSPPYFGMRTYLPDQWIRLWFLGGPDHVNYRYCPGQLEHSNAVHFSSEMNTVWKNIAKHATKDARLVIRYGGIHDRKGEPMDILKLSLKDSGWRVVATRTASDCNCGRRQASQFQATPQQPIVEHDVYCHLN